MPQKCKYELGSQNSKHKITLHELTCRKNQSIFLTSEIKHCHCSMNPFDNYSHLYCFDHTKTNTFSGLSHLKLRDEITYRMNISET